MCPRARRSESITLPPGNHPVLGRYNDDKSYTGTTTTEKPIDHYDDDENDSEYEESDLDGASDDSYDNNDSNTNSVANSVVLE